MSLFVVGKIESIRPTENDSKNNITMIRSSKEQRPISVQSYLFKDICVMLLYTSLITKMGLHAKCIILFYVIIKYGKRLFMTLEKSLLVPSIGISFENKEYIIYSVLHNFK